MTAEGRIRPPRREACGVRALQRRSGSLAFSKSAGEPAQSKRLARSSPNLERVGHDRAQVIRLDVKPDQAEQERAHIRMFPGDRTHADHLSLDPFDVGTPTGPLQEVLVGNPPGHPADSRRFTGYGCGDGRDVANLDRTVARASAKRADGECQLSQRHAGSRLAGTTTQGSKYTNTRPRSSFMAFVNFVVRLRAGSPSSERVLVVALDYLPLPSV